MKLYVIAAILFVGVLLLALNPGFIADHVVAWAKQNVSNTNTPEMVYDAGRVCQILQGGDAAVELYNYLYQTYPNNAVLCAPAMYFAGEVEANSSMLKVYRMQAVPFLEIVVNQYADQQDWATKAQALIDEVNSAK